MTEAAVAPKLKLTTKSTHYVGWYDLSEFLSYHLFGAQGYTFDLLEASNDTDHSVDVALTKHDLDKIWVDERSQLVSELQSSYQREVRENADVPENKSYMRKRYVGVEEYNLNTLMIAAHERGWLEAGNYVVRLSW